MITIACTREEKENLIHCIKSSMQCPYPEHECDSNDCKLCAEENINWLILEGGA